jgi:hypothetical protein
VLGNSDLRKASIGKVESNFSCSYVRQDPRYGLPTTDSNKDLLRNRNSDVSAQGV